ncbi:MAG: 1-acyl-sn-glycerol-3-phosphate acyltransferase, partial [Pseudomonadota bacterium]
MKTALQWGLSLIFIIQMYVVMVVLAIVFMIPMMAHPKGALWACHTYCKWVMWSARVLIGLKVDIRGTPPMDEVLVAAKHQSFFDIIV